MRARKLYSAESSSGLRYRWMLFVVSGLLLCPSAAFSQALQIGCETGVMMLNPSDWEEPVNSEVVTFGSVVTYRPEQKIFSFNQEFRAEFHKSGVELSVPITVKLHIGKQLCFTPEIGGYFTTYSASGLLYGFGLDYRASSLLSVFMGFQRMSEYYDKDVPNHTGGTDHSTEKRSKDWLGAGVRLHVGGGKQTP